MHTAERERPFLAAKGFNTNLVRSLPSYHVIINKVHVFPFTCTISHVHRLAPTMVLRTRNFGYEKLYFFVKRLRT